MKLEISELAGRLQSFLPGLSEKDLRKLAPLLQERIKMLSEAREVGNFALVKPTLEKSLIAAKSSTNEVAWRVISSSIQILDKIEIWRRGNLEKALEALREKLQISKGELLWPIRYSLTGSLYSPGAFEVLEYLGKKESLFRLKKAERLLSGKR